MKRTAVFLLFISFAFVMISCTSFSGIEKTKTINVSGTGEVSLKSDMVSFHVKVSEIAETTKEAQQITNEKIIKLLEIMKSSGIKEDDLSTESLDISTAYEWQDNKQVRIGERVTQSISVKFKKLDAFGKLMDQISDVSGISVYGISFDASDKTESLIKARKLAFEDAREKAKAYCEISGMKLSDPVLISEGYSTYNARTASNSLKAAMAVAEDMAYGTEVPSGLLKVAVNVDCSFEIR